MSGLSDDELRRRKANALFRFRWMEAVLAAPDLRPGEKLVALRLGLHRNDQTLICNPSVTKLAKGTRQSWRYVYECLGVLRAGRWITWTERPGKVNSFSLLSANVPVAPLISSSGVAEAPLNPSSMTPELQISNPCSGVQTNLFNHNHNLEGAAAGKSEGDAGSLARPPKPATDQERWRVIQKEFGLKEVYLGDVVFERIAGRTVYLMARSPREATEIEQTFGEDLLAYWRLCRPNVAKLRVLSLSADAEEAAPQ